MQLFYCYAYRILVGDRPATFTRALGHSLGVFLHLRTGAFYTLINFWFLLPLNPEGKGEGWKSGMSVSSWGAAQEKSPLFTQRNPVSVTPIVAWRSTQRVRTTGVLLGIVLPSFLSS
jgi:hypothetical protein